jgi:trimethylamine:corrinoid methyltransferase-like protein
MSNQHLPPFLLTRPALIDSGQSERIHALAKRILAEIGLEILDMEHREKLASAGFTLRDNRLLLDPALVDEHVAEMRRRLQAEQSGGEKGLSDSLTVSVSSYALFSHNLDTGAVEPMTTLNLIENTKLLDSLAEDGVYGVPPGIPTDVHPDLQPLAQYRIAANYARQGATPVDPTAPHTARFLLEMAAAMGHPMHSLPVYLPTPLRLGGESLAVVMSCLDQLDHIWVSSMPATGLSSPTQPFGALALAAAEVLGGMIAVKTLTGKPVTCGVQIFPGDLREGSMVFGSPENMRFQMLSDDFSTFYGRPWGSAPGNFHVMAKMPDVQSAAEKAAIMMFGASLGARHFSCAGTLSLDEIFSGEQLLLDCEIRDWVQTAVRGIDLGENECTEWLEEIRRGVERNFMELDSTLDNHQKHIWYPRRFTRKAIGPWLEEGQPKLSDRLRAEAKRRIARHQFELDADKKRELERIYTAAEKAIHF